MTMRPIGENKCRCCDEPTGKNPGWCDNCHENCREQILEDEKLSIEGEHKVDPPPDDWTLEYKKGRMTLVIHGKGGDSNELQPLIRLVNPSFEIKRNSISIKHAGAVAPGFVHAPYIPDRYEEKPVKHGETRTYLGCTPVDLPRDKYDHSPCQCEHCKECRHAKKEAP